MLDRALLTQQILSSTQPFLARRGQQLELALQIWARMASDPEVYLQVLRHKFSLGLPIWSQDLNFGQVQSLVNPGLLDYTVVACDGSQIYPDRHAGTNCYLINIGQSILRYSSTLEHSSSASFANQPYFFTDLNGATPAAELVDSHRHSLEMQVGLQVTIAEQALAKRLIYLIDGSLIAWHLEGKSPQLQAEFLPKYLQQLTQFEQLGVPSVGYISLPNSRELINLLGAYQANFVTGSINQTALELLTDADLLWELLQPGEYLGWFVSGVVAAQVYPEALRPYFVYLHTGQEIARVEFPAWVIAQPALFELCLQVVFDQVVKGQGYPVALAEAHMQAVVKTHDKQFFYSLLQQVSERHGQTLTSSRKSAQKRVMNI